MEFNIVIEEVMKGTVPEEVLKDYVGTYDLEFKGTILEKLQMYVGGPYKEMPLKIENEGTQVYMTFPFTPRTEIIWSQKDQFQAWAFFRSSIRFVRTQSGKIANLELHYGLGNNIIRGIRQNNR